MKVSRRMRVRPQTSLLSAFDLECSFELYVTTNTILS